MPLPPRPLSVAVPRIVWLADVTTSPDAWLVIVSVGELMSGVDDPVMVQTNDRDTVTRPSFTKTVTLYVPAVSGVPEICPVEWLSVSPSGRPVWVKVSEPVRIGDTDRER